MPFKYDRIGTNYNQTRTSDPFLLSRMQYHLNPIPSGNYLDVGCGTGNYTIALNQKGLRFTGLEPSAKMLKVAAQKSSEIHWQSGTAEELPIESSTFDGVLASLTIHHWADIAGAFKEVCRVLKPGGRFVLFSSTPKQMEGYWLNVYFPEMLRASIVQMPAYDLIKSHLEKAAFKISCTEKYFIKPDLQDLFLYAGKHRPQLYLDANVRSGISSFAALAHADEVVAGLSKLSSDIASGSIEKIIQEWENDCGDYLFVIAEKCNF